MSWASSPSFGVKRRWRRLLELGNDARYSLQCRGFPLPSHGLAMEYDLFFIRFGSDQSGPYSGEQVKQLADCGRLKPTDLICQGLSNQWHQAATIVGLFSTVVPPPVAVPAEDTTQTIYRYVIPLRWSLSFALTPAQWRGVRERHKKLDPSWERCDCPQGCKADQLDEEWHYDHLQHIKTFLGAQFICRGCHWRKSPGFRLRTYSRPLPSQFTKPPHIISCLGWSQDEVDRFVQHDLWRARQQQVIISQIEQKIQHGTAVALPSPIERLSASDVERFIQPGRTVVVPWRVDLTHLGTCGYSPQEIQKFENRMYDVAAKRMQSREAHDAGLGGD